MAKPRIIILMHYLELGGAESALIGLLGALAPKRVEVDLFIYDHRGPLMQYIPEWVNILPQVKAYSMIERPMTEALRAGAFGVVTGRLLAKLKHRLYRKGRPAEMDDSSIMQYIGDCVTPHLPEINQDVEYDLCISFLTPHNIGRDKVKARKRLSWIHTDYSTVSINASQELPVWNAYDHIASISSDVTHGFLSVFPSLAPKIIQIENIMPKAIIQERSQQDNAEGMDSGEVRLLSIGRYCTAKNYDNVPAIASLMLDCGVKGLKWYIIGYGSDEELIRKKIQETGMEQHVILLGKKDNPYPYIKTCDIYVQPSRYEGKSITVREAQILGKPVVVTNYPTAPSQINNGVDGIIVPLDNEGCAHGIAEFINNTHLRQQIIENLRRGDYANAAEVEKIYNLLK